MKVEMSYYGGRQTDVTAESLKMETSVVWLINDYVCGLRGPPEIASVFQGEEEWGTSG